MLVIREAQMAVFEHTVRRNIKEQVVGEIERELPFEFARLGESVIREWIEIAEKQIDRYDGYFHFDAARYVHLMIDFGPAFHKSETWAAGVLADPQIPGVSKLDVLETLAADRARDLDL